VFAPLRDADLDQLLCHEEERTVGRDNVVVLEGLALQLAKQPGRRSCAGLRVTVRRHLSGVHTVWRGPHCLGHYDAGGQPQPGPRPRPPKPLPPVGASQPPCPRRREALTGSRTASWRAVHIWYPPKTRM
jgi:hypothetical protein